LTNSETARAWRIAMDGHWDAFSDLKSCLHALEILVECAAETVRDGGKILLFGNGGSASDAQHIAAELVCRLKENRKPIAAMALACEPATATAIGNDLGFQNVFARQLSALAKPEDLAIAITTSGNSPNVNAALAACAIREIKTGVRS
jgi:D-sedoheptulose 7-phosphate isomerase